MITIINYGLGNISAFINAFNQLNLPIRIASRYNELENATKLILPGVGAFDNAMRKLEKSGMAKELDDLVINKRVPILAVCVGMQMLACSSEEGCMPGLGWIDGKVKRFSPSSRSQTMRVPHMGWNNVKPIKSDGLFLGLDYSARFYFLHSYYFKNSCSEDTIAVTDYYGEFSCAVNRGNIYGVQFHPEKSHHWGLSLLENFAKL